MDKVSFDRRRTGKQRRGARNEIPVSVSVREMM